MKRFTIILLAIGMVALTGCGGADTNGGSDTSAAPRATVDCANYDPTTTKMSAASKRYFDLECGDPADKAREAALEDSFSKLYHETANPAEGEWEIMDQAVEVTGAYTDPETSAKASKFTNKMFYHGLNGARSFSIKYQGLLVHSTGAWHAEVIEIDGEPAEGNGEGLNSFIE